MLFLFVCLFVVWFIVFFFERDWLQELLGLIYSKFKFALPKIWLGAMVCVFSSSTEWCHPMKQVAIKTFSRVFMSKYLWLTSVGWGVWRHPRFSCRGMDTAMTVLCKSSPLTLFSKSSTEWGFLVSLEGIRVCNLISSSRLCFHLPICQPKSFCKDSTYECRENDDAIHFLVAFSALC